VVPVRSEGKVIYTIRPGLATLFPAVFREKGGNPARCNHAGERLTALRPSSPDRRPGEPYWAGANLSGHLQ